MRNKSFYESLCSEPLGKLLFLLTNLLLIFSNFVITKYILIKWFGPQNKNLSLYESIQEIQGNGVYLFWIYESIFTIIILCYYRASFSDPGYIDNYKLQKPENILPEKYIKLCMKCDKIWKPPRAHHCKKCERCVFKMDHHCDWINNCVGLKNQKYFIIFLGYVLIYSLCTAGLLIMHLIMYMTTRDPNKPITTLGRPNEFQFPWSTLFLIVLTIITAFFIFFAFDFLYEQIESISENQTTIETHKNQIGRPGSFMDNFKKVFGVNKLWWLLPVKPKLRINFLEMLYYPNELDEKEHKGYLEDELDFNTKYKAYFAE